MHQHLAVVRLLNEVVQHLFRHLEIGDDAVFHRLDGDDVAGRAAKHLLGLFTHGFYFTGVLLMATMEGSLTTMPLPRAYTSVLAVPRSMARSLENMLNSERMLPTREGRLWNPLDDITTASFYEDRMNIRMFLPKLFHTCIRVIATRCPHPQT